MSCRSYLAVSILVHAGAMPQDTNHTGKALRELKAAGIIGGSVAEALAGLAEEAGVGGWGAAGGGHWTWPPVLPSVPLPAIEDACMLHISVPLYAGIIAEAGAAVVAAAEVVAIVVVVVVAVVAIVAAFCGTCRDFIEKVRMVEMLVSTCMT